MDLFGRLLCLLLVMVCKIDADYVPTEIEYTWSQANEECTLATPNLTFSASGVTPDLDITDVWLGYVENMTPFEYFGCAMKSDLNLSTADYTTEGDPGQCWSACKNFIAVAVYDSKCYCLQEVPVNINLMNQRCDKKCPGQLQIVCGGMQGQHDEYVSLYKTTYTGPINTSNLETSFCLLYDNVTNTFSWRQCTEAYHILCFKDNVTLKNIQPDDWKTVTEKCFKGGGIPSNYNNTMLVNTHENAEIWTGIVRIGVINPVTDFPNILTGKYGYVSNTNNLSFTNNQTVTKKALCVEGTINTNGTDSGKQTTTPYVSSTNFSTSNNTTKQTITTSQTTDISNKTEGEANTGTQTSTSVVTSTRFGTSDDINETNTSSQTTDTSNQNEKTTHQQTSITGENTADEKRSLKKESSNVGVIVGVILTIIIVIIIAVVIIVLWKRGMKIPFIQKKKPDKERIQAINLTYHVSGLDNTNQGTFEADTTDYAEVDISTMTPENNQTQNGDANIISNSSDEPHTYYVLENVENGQNDTTKTSTTRQEEDTINSKNKLKSPENKQTQNENTNKITVSSEGTFESSTTDYAEVDVSKMLPGNKVTQSGNTKRYSDSSDEPHTYFVLQNNEDGPYDTTKTLNMRQEQDNFNPYNKLSLEKSSNYDHIGTRDESHKDTPVTDNPYNKTTLGYSWTNHGFTNSAFNTNDESENAYNHIGDQPRQNGGKPLDNTYNTTILGTSVINLGVNTNARNKDDESEDTYNHINGEFVPTRGKFTDNDYGTLNKMI